MARSRNLTPSYLLHKQSGRGRLVWTDSAGIHHDIILPGEYGSKESLAAKARKELELATAPHHVIRGSATTVNEILLPFLEWAEKHYRTSDGEKTSEVREYKLVCRHLRELYGTTVAAEFGPLALKALRQRFIGLGWCRGVINQRIGRAVRLFKWAVAEELIPPAVHQGLATVDGLRAGRSEAPDTDPIKPVDPATVSATLPFLNRHLRAMVGLMQTTGARPGEICRMKLSQIDRSGQVWKYFPNRHKTQHHGKGRTIMIGPRGRAIIEGFIAEGTVVDPTAPLFSPRRAREERFAAMRAARKSQVQPCQRDRRKVKPKLQPAEVYSSMTFAHAVAKAAEKAGAEHWHPNQIRHNVASEVRKVHGLEAAQVLLGHSRADVTQVYAERDAGLAEEVASKIG